MRPIGRQEGYWMSKLKFSLQASHVMLQGIVLRNNSTQIQKLEDQM